MRHSDCDGWELTRKAESFVHTNPLHIDRSILSYPIIGRVTLLPEGYLDTQIYYLGPTCCKFIFVQLKRKPSRCSLSRLSSGLKGSIWQPYNSLCGTLSRCYPANIGSQTFQITHCSVIITLDVQTRPFEADSRWDQLIMESRLCERLHNAQSLIKHVPDILDRSRDNPRATC